MKRWILALTLFCSFTTAFADNSVGCGLGSMIWKKNSILSALFRLTTNHSFSTQLFGITTGTSGCSRHSIVMNEMAPVYYAEANIENLRVDMALGEGEYLDAFAATLGCGLSLQSSFNKASRQNYGRIFNSEDISPYQMLTNVKKVLNETAATKGKCRFAII